MTVPVACTGLLVSGAWLVSAKTFDFCFVGVFPLIQWGMFKDRIDAGLRLANLLVEYKNEDLIVFGLPRGGVVVAYEVAKVLNAPLDVVVVRKLGLLSDPEFAIGAVSENGVQVFDNKSINESGITKAELTEIVRSQKEELNRRIKLYRLAKPLPVLRGKTAILVDDGLATGLTALAAIKSLKKLKPKKIILAVPVIAYQTIEKVRSYVDKLVSLLAPNDLEAVGSYYKNFSQVSDGEVIELLEQNRRRFEMKT